ncbi:MAG: ribosome assembly RNA-binding protein YhbY [Verrucomicrobiota bacterium]
MSAIPLSGKQRRHLKSLAHHLEPVVFLGKEGITDGLIEGVQKALRDHELIKIKFVAFKDQKKELSLQIAEKTSSAHVDNLGHIAIFFKSTKGKISMDPKS